MDDFDHSGFGMCTSSISSCLTTLHGGSTMSGAGSLTTCLSQTTRYQCHSIGLRVNLWHMRCHHLPVCWYLYSNRQQSDRQVVAAHVPSAAAYTAAISSSSIHSTQQSAYTAHTPQSAYTAHTTQSAYTAHTTQSHSNQQQQHATVLTE